MIDPRFFGLGRNCLRLFSAVGFMLATGLAVAQNLGPENVLLVVNAQDPTSLLIANHYQHLRRIPARNVVYLPEVPREQVTSLDSFRGKILQPIVEEIRRRGLEPQIDCITYSAGFPTAVMLNELREVFLKDQIAQEPINDEKVYYPRGAINALTFYADAVLANDSRLFSFRANHYYQAPANPAVSQPFDRQLVWSEGQPAPADQPGQRYYLSTVLAATWDHANSEQEALKQLQRTVAADGTRPSGVFFFTSTKDVRTQTRLPNFDIAIEQLRTMGFEATVVEGNLPTGGAVAGAMIGIASYAWEKNDNTIVPGAICDNLTSFGGMLAEPSQTKLTDFIRHGAAGSSGTVVEPFALQMKFPHPLLHVYYTRGFTLAESFYQSVQAPLQLLIVGDPLCRPWATLPTVQVEGLDPAQEVSGTLHLRLRAGTDSPALRRVDVYVDERPVGRKDLNEPLPFNSQKLADGYHELRLVAVAEDAAATSQTQVIPLQVNNRGGRCDARCANAKVPVGKPLEIEVASDAPGVWSASHNGRELARAAQAVGRLSVDSKLLGRGPCRLVCTFRGEDGQLRIAAPLDVEITGPLRDEPTRLAAERPAKTKASPAKKAP